MSARSQLFPVWFEIARHAHRAPSPHNTQPYRLKIINLREAEVVFLPRRGLYVADPLGRFTWLTAGVFIEICSIAAHWLAFELEVIYDLTPMYANGDVETPQTIARLRLVPKDRPVDDLDPKLVLQRQTSRLPYDGTVCPPEVIGDLKAEGRRHNHEFETRIDAEAIRWVIELNKQALFHDLDDEGQRTELTKWLRFDQREEDLMNDGLSARCLTFNGPLLRSFFTHHKFWTMPGIRNVVGAVYGSTMKGIGTIGWLRGRYVTIEDWVTAGKVMIRLWLMLTRHGYYWHPYGSVITSEKARLNMIEYLSLPDEAGGERMVWLLLRMGRSAKPPVSKRLPLEEIVLCSC
ncbi:MAG TPA: hypothetical protein VGH39_01725 [Xanthobacteraceae bacterium]